MQTTAENLVCRFSWDKKLARKHQPCLDHHHRSLVLTPTVLSNVKSKSNLYKVSFFNIYFENLFWNFCTRQVRDFFSNCGLFCCSFNQKFHKDYRNIQILPLRPKLAELCKNYRTFLLRNSVQWTILDFFLINYHFQCYFIKFQKCQVPSPSKKWPAKSFSVGFFNFFGILSVTKIEPFYFKNLCKRSSSFLFTVCCYQRGRLVEQNSSRLVS